MAAPEDATTASAGRRVVARGVVWSFAGQGLPLLVALVAMPFLIAGYGTERFGILALVLATFGYFSMFDLGMGRALTQWIAAATADRTGRDVGGTIRAGLAVTALLGMLGGAILFAITPWLVSRALVMPDALQGEARLSFLLVAAAIPLLSLSQALRGILEAHLRFGLINAVRVPLSCLSLLGPLLLLPFTDNLVPAVGVILASRVIGGAIFLRACLRVQPELRGGLRFDPGAVVPLVRFGGWMTVSNVVGPLMVSFDRFLIGSVISVAATAYYAAPYDMVTKLWIVPGAFVAVLFPAFAMSATADPARMERLYLRGLRYTAALLFPAVLVVVVFAHEILTLWLGPAFADESAGVLRLLALGVMANSLAQVPFALVQGIGRADVTAKLHLAEAPVYLLVLWWAVGRFGIEGAAIAWGVRAVADAGLLFVAAARLSACPVKPVLPLLASVGAGSALAGALALVPDAGDRLIMSATVLGMFAMFTWVRVLSDEDRHSLSLRQVAR